jgi:hypothetical protein
LSSEFFFQNKIVRKYRKKLITKIREAPVLNIYEIRLLENYNAIIELFLKKHIKGSYLESRFADIFIMIRELTSNAIKANYKYFYFRIRNIEDIPEEAERLLSHKIIDFISENWNDAFFMMLQKEHNLRVRLLYKEVYNYKIFGVENTRPMSRTEKNRITDIIKRIGKQKNIEDFLRHYGEKGEGGGMGIYIIIAYLKKMGLSYRSLFYTFSPSTIAYLIFPNTNPKIGIQKLIPSYIIE